MTSSNGASARRFLGKICLLFGSVQPVSLRTLAKNCPLSFSKLSLEISLPYYDELSKVKENFLNNIIIFTSTIYLFFSFKYN